MTHPEPEAIPLSDPRVVQLGRFLQEAPVSNGGVAKIPEGQSELLAQAVLNWQDNLIYDGGQWLARAVVESSPEFGDVEIKSLGNDEAFRLVHRPTGITVIEETRRGAWAALTTKVREASNAK
ncbi:hypothetical protein [Rhodococcus sp. ARP2]|uniref:hypothetical protein n=1 Tax=Rhodococcus sp. ARP2 TaxID=1661385 RepID=UPI00064C341F|nr:hypothetical protein [Rhodococcus sp. ARP2]